MGYDWILVLMNTLDHTSNYKKKVRDLHAWPCRKLDERLHRAMQEHRLILNPRPPTIPRAHLPTAFPPVMNYRVAMKSYVRDCWICESKLNRLQDVSSETEETSKAGTGEGHGLVGA